MPLQRTRRVMQRSGKSRDALPAFAGRQFLLRRGWGVVFVGGEGAALVALGDRVFCLAGFGGQDLGGVGLGIVLRSVAEAVGVRSVVPRALVVRDPIDDLEA